MESPTGPTNVDAYFSRDPAGLPTATPTRTVDLSDGDTYDLVAAPVRKQIGDADVRMLAYNGSIPGPTLRVPEGAVVTVRFANHIDLESTVHWHGLRLENRFDGVPQATQAPVPVGGTFEYQIRFPDPGVYWYHPHLREDYSQEMGLYGNILVVPSDPEYWPPVHRDVVLTLDDILIEDGRIAPFRRLETTHAAMGRFGNVFLTGGETNPGLTARRGEVVRFYLTNTANTRFFNVAIPGARVKLIGGDSGRYEHEVFVDTLPLAPSERVVVDVLFDRPGQMALEHRTPKQTYPLATIDVSAELAVPPLDRHFGVLRHNPEWMMERGRLAPYVEAPPDKTLAFVAEMNMGSAGESGAYACPMHPEMVSTDPGRCPKCGMKLLPVTSGRQPAAAATHAHHGDGHQATPHEDHDRANNDQDDATVHWREGQSLPVAASQQAAALRGQGHHVAHAEQSGGRPSQHTDDRHHLSHGRGRAEEAGGIEWEDEMVDMNRMTTPANTRWNLVDRATGAVNHAIDWQFRVGDKVKLRLINELDSDHPMPHPFHIHGGGRFVVLARDDMPEENLVWKDTVLVRTGQTVDILLDVTNLGVWLAHCHIAEHHESGMMFSFTVVE